MSKENEGYNCHICTAPIAVASNEAARLISRCSNHVFVCQSCWSIYACIAAARVESRRKAICVPMVHGFEVHGHSLICDNQRTPNDGGPPPDTTP